MDTVYLNKISSFSIQAGCFALLLFTFFFFKPSSSFASCSMESTTFNWTGYSVPRWGIHSRSPYALCTASPDPELLKPLALPVKVKLSPFSIILGEQNSMFNIFVKSEDMGSRALVNRKTLPSSKMLYCLYGLAKIKGILR